MVGIDTDVLVLAFRFHRDERQELNSRFLLKMRDENPIVAIYTVMELLGQLSFNFSPDRLARWPIWLQAEYALSVVYPEFGNEGAEGFFRRELVERPFQKMRNRMPYQDALILGLMEQVPSLTTFVTWNARHFRGKSPIEVLTPVEYLSVQSS